MFCAIESTTNSRGEFWKITDSVHGEKFTGWATWRSIPTVIISEYSIKLNEDPLPNLRAYYLSRSRNLSEIIEYLQDDLLESDQPYNSTTRSAAAYFAKCAPCITNYLKRMQYIGVLR